MKQTRIARMFAIAVAAVLMCAFAVAFVACDKGGEKNTGEVTVNLILGDAESVSVTTDEAYLYGMLQDYCAGHGIALEAEDGAYGFFLTRVGDMVNGDGSYIMLYHDIDDVTLYTPGYDMEIGGRTYHSSSLGVSQLPLRDGATYAVVAISY